MLGVVKRKRQKHRDLIILSSSSIHHAVTQREKRRGSNGNGYNERDAKEP